MNRRKYRNRPPGPYSPGPIPPVEVIELRGQRELAGEPLPPPVDLIPVGSIEGVEGINFPTRKRTKPRPLVPTADELAALPAAARTAYAARCGERAGVAVDPADPSGAVRRAAEAMLLTATTATPVGRTLRRLRRDFDRLVWLAGKHGWTDDTPVPADVFGRPR